MTPHFFDKFMQMLTTQGGITQVVRKALDAMPAEEREKVFEQWRNTRHPALKQWLADLEGMAPSTTNNAQFAQTDLYGDGYGGGYDAADSQHTAMIYESDSLPEHRVYTLNAQHMDFTPSTIKPPNLIPSIMNLFPNGVALVFLVSVVLAGWWIWDTQLPLESSVLADEGVVITGELDEVNLDPYLPTAHYRFELDGEIYTDELIINPRYFADYKLGEVEVRYLPSDPNITTLEGVPSLRAWLDPYLIYIAIVAGLIVVGQLLDILKQIYQLYKRYGEYTLLMERGYLLEAKIVRVVRNAALLYEFPDPHNGKIVQHKINLPRNSHRHNGYEPQEGMILRLFYADKCTFVVL